MGKSAPLQYHYSYLSYDVLHCICIPIYICLVLKFFLHLFGSKPESNVYIMVILIMAFVSFCAFLFRKKCYILFELLLYLKKTLEKQKKIFIRIAREEGIAWIFQGKVHVYILNNFLFFSRLCSRCYILHIVYSICPVI